MSSRHSAAMSVSKQKGTEFHEKKCGFASALTVSLLPEMSLDGWTDSEHQFGQDVAVISQKGCLL